MPATLQIRRLRVCARPHPGELRDSAAGDAAASGWGRRRRRGVWRGNELLCRARSTDDVAGIFLRDELGERSSSPDCKGP
uniref:Uncharacterized protein n=1 Tax=Leersia perrieri TaxID=77586 RepID=A0A0D9UYR7_9ORYZ